MIDTPEIMRHNLKTRLCVSGSAVAILFSLPHTASSELTIRQVADEALINRSPVISETGLIVWYAGGRGAENSDSDIYIHSNGVTKSITKDAMWDKSASVHPKVQSNIVVWQSTYETENNAQDVTWVMREVPQKEGEPEEEWALYQIAPGSDGNADLEPDLQKWMDTPTNDVDGVATRIREAYTTKSGSLSAYPANTAYAATNAPEFKRRPSGNNEICLWRGSSIERITEDYRNDLGPAFYGNLLAWQKAKSWPFGWEIMVWDDSYRAQLTTNFYYDMGAQVDQDKVTWYGWDGNDFEIFLYDHTERSITQVTSNQYDDVSPSIHNGMLAWEGYPALESDIFIWEDKTVNKLTSNIEDDINPIIWNGKIVWQGFDGDDFEIYYFDGEKTIKLTSNLYDDINPDFRDGIVTWMGFHDNWDSEIFAWDGRVISMLTTNEYDDRMPRTAGGSVVWYGDDIEKSYIFVAEPK